MQTQTLNLIEDVSTEQQPQIILQVKSFLNNNTDPLLFLEVIHKGFPYLKNTTFNLMAAGLQNMAETRLIQNVAKELEAARQAYVEKNTKAVKPAEIYRKYAKALRAVKENGHQEDTRMLAHETLNDLFLAQSLSNGELETPDWIDPYTGELDPTYEPDFEMDSLADLMQRVEMVSPLQNDAYARALELKEELGYDQATVDRFMRAQSGSDGWKGDPEEMWEDRGYVPPTGEQGLTIDKGAFALAAPAMAEFNRWRTGTFERMKLNGTYGETWKECFLTFKEESAEVANLITTIAEVADNYDITTAAAIALKIDGDYGLTVTDLNGIGGFTLESVYYELNAYIAEWGDDVLDLMQDSLPASSPTSDIDTFDATTLAKLTELLPEKHHNPMQTKSYIVAYMEAIMGGATLGEAENSALAVWREAMSKAGAIAYATAWANSKSKSVAWRAFWTKCGPDVPRPQEHVKSVQGNLAGLVLTSERRIDWNIAALKLKNNELVLEPEQKQKLKTLLTQKGMRNNPVIKYL
jgi:hypothetical protein